MKCPGKVFKLVQFVCKLSVRSESMLFRLAFVGLLVAAVAQTEEKKLEKQTDEVPIKRHNSHNSHEQQHVVLKQQKKTDPSTPPPTTPTDTTSASGGALAAPTTVAFVVAFLTIFLF